MGLFNRLLHREPDAETPARGVPSPPADVECTACGWDMREAYHDDLSGADHEAVR
ncbi:hypothetical protein OJ997_07320 [Solirubrobacter phytolaccae]|uniref:Uncharacterized protein n=1 Tax=Solirubrobacter phytolaccae TaxID=1404360 RepID=A0A9X3N9L0_9ACTN|nr:hypothetical protein [Solirubrobacter phytolaccae]MDA0180101.1 hypothetical protein [Solirubrobacter phytolaccae]